MTPQEIWTRLKTAFQTGSTLEDRITQRIDLMKSQALSTSAALTGFRDRLLDLELRNEQVDATYVRTVTLALSENLEKRDAAINDRYNRLEANWAATELELRNQLDIVTAESARIHGRLDALIHKLRAGLE